MDNNKNKIATIVEKATGFDCALKLVGYTIVLMIVNSCVDNISNPKLKKQEKFYKEIIEQQCRERISQQIILAIKDISINKENNSDGIQLLESMRQQMLDNCTITIDNKHE